MGTMGGMKLCKGVSAVVKVEGFGDGSLKVVSAQPPAPPSPSFSTFSDHFRHNCKRLFAAVDSHGMASATI